MTALKTQVGGDHYSKMKIQPVEYCMANGMDICQGNIIKYVSRFRSKNGIQDLKKARHMLDLLIDFETAKINEVKPPLQYPEVKTEPYHGDPAPAPVVDPICPEDGVRCSKGFKCAECPHK